MRSAMRAANQLPGKGPTECVQLTSYLERGPLMWMMPLHLHVNQKSDYDDDDKVLDIFKFSTFSHAIVPTSYLSLEHCSCYFQGE